MTALPDTPPDEDFDCLHHESVDVERFADALDALAAELRRSVSRLDAAVMWKKRYDAANIVDAGAQRSTSGKVGQE